MAMLTLVVVTVLFVAFIIVVVVGGTSSCDISGCTLNTGRCDYWGTD